MNGVVSKKMGLKADSRAFLLDAPPEAVAAIDPPPLEIAPHLKGDFDYIHFFVKTQDEFNDRFPELKKHLKPLPEKAFSRFPV